MLRRFELRVSEIKGILWVTGYSIMILNLEEADAREIIRKDIPFLWDKAMEDHENSHVNNYKSLSNYQFGKYKKLEDKLLYIYFQ